MPAAVDGSRWEWVDEPGRLAAVAEEARSAGALAVDVEHHHVRSNRGIVCLLQLSTGDSSPLACWPGGCCTRIKGLKVAGASHAGHKDYLIDALALHDHMHLLHSLLADPGILKVPLRMGGFACMHTKRYASRWVVQATAGVAGRAWR